MKKILRNILLVFTICFFNFSAGSYSELDPPPCNPSSEWAALRSDIVADQGAGPNKLLPYLKSIQPKEARLNAWKIAFQHGDDLRIDIDFLTQLNQHLNDFPNLKTDLDDPVLYDTYKKIKDNYEQGYEVLDGVEGDLTSLPIQQAQSAQADEWWRPMVKGKKFEVNTVLPKLSNRTSLEYLLLKDKTFQEFGINLDEFDLYDNVQLGFDPVTLSSGRVVDYFIPDQLYIKWVEHPTIPNQYVIDDVLIVENKLKSTTELTIPQGYGKAASQLRVRSVDKPAYGNENPSQITLVQDSEISINDKWIKIYGPDSGDGDEIINMVKLE